MKLGHFRSASAVRNPRKIALGLENESTSNRGSGDPPIKIGLEGVNIMQHKITFKSKGLNCSALLYLPNNAASTHNG